MLTPIQLAALPDMVRAMVEERVTCSTCNGRGSWRSQHGSRKRDVGCAACGGNSLSLHARFAYERGSLGTGQQPTAKARICAALVEADADFDTDDPGNRVIMFGQLGIDFHEHDCLVTSYLSDPLWVIPYSDAARVAWLITAITTVEGSTTRE